MSYAPTYGDEAAFVFDGKKMFDLNTLMDDSGSGFQLMEAYAIDAEGVITGLAEKDDMIVAFVATPIRP